MANRELGVPVLVGYLALWWGGVAVAAVFLSSNTAPTAPELKLKEEPILTTTKIVVQIAKEGEDPDAGAEVKYTYAWTKNGELIADNSGDSVDSRATTKGDTFEVTVTPDDGSKGGWGCSLPWRHCAGDPSKDAKLQVVIGNSAPRARILFRGPDNVPTRVFDGSADIPAELGCSDPDFSELEAAAPAADPAAPPPADPCTYTVKWFAVSDTPVILDAPPAPDFTYGPGASAKDAFLPKDAWKKASTWKVVVVANDGEMDGPEVEETIRKAE